MDGWTFHEREGRIVSADRSETLTPRAAAVLSCLLRRRGEVVSREDLLAEAWPDRHVEPALVREHVHHIRSAL